MAVFDNINLTSSAGVAPSVVEYHEKNLLKNIKPKLIHQRDMQMRNLPAHNGRRVQFRRYVPFKACTEPLAEGITPPGQELQMTDMWATILPYGRHVEVSDEMNWALLDDTHRIINEALADQAALTLDTLAGNAYHSGLNVRYANNKTARSAITSADKLTYDDIRKAVRDLKKNMAKKFADGFYHAFVDVDTVFDLTDKTNNPLWVDVATYQDKRMIETGELGCMAGVKFFEDQNAKMFGTAEDAVIGTSSIASIVLTNTTYDKASKSVKFTTNGITDEVARKMLGAMVMVGATTKVAAVIESIDVANKVIRFRNDLGDTLPASSTVTPYGTSEVPVHSTVIYGQDFCGGISLEGNGHNVQVIINPVGSSGALDPLSQRGAMAWKIKGVCYTVLQDAFGVRIEHAAS